MRTIDAIGLVGGGQMGEALIRGMISSGLQVSDRTTVAEPNTERLQ